MSKTEHSSTTQNNKQNKKQTIIIVLLVLIIVIAIGAIIYLLNRNDEKDTVLGGRGTVVTKENVDELENQVITDGSYTTSMSIDWHFTGTESKDAYVANDPVNTRTVYFDLLLADSGKMIYSSPYIPVGAELDGVTLDTQLKPGTYETVMVYHLVDDSEQEVANLSVGLTIYVE